MISRIQNGRASVKPTGEEDVFIPCGTLVVAIGRFFYPDCFPRNSSGHSLQRPIESPDPFLIFHRYLLINGRLYNGLIYLHCDQSRHTKKGLAADACYADCAVLIPETLERLPYKVFLTSSIDAFIHAVESFLSPKASPATELFSGKAIEMILSGYHDMAESGRETRKNNLRSIRQCIQALPEAHL